MHSDTTLNQLEHTPGPWIFSQRDADGIISITANGKDVAVIGTCNGDRDYADAALIAAAPDLLKSCKMFVHMLESGQLVRNMNDDHYPDWPMKILMFTHDLQNAVMAIAKAENR